MRRRDFVTLIGMAAAAQPVAVLAQSTARKIPVVGVLWHAGNAEEEDVYLSVVQKAFHDLGYVEGKSIVLEHRFPAENPQRFRELAHELVEAKPDVIIGVSSLGAVELKKATSTIPIVFVVVADPVGFGLVNSLAHPGGNATGPSMMLLDLSGKRLSLLKEAVPNLSRVALLIDAADLFKQRVIKAYQAAAEASGIEFWSIEIATPEDIEPAFSKVAQDHSNGVIISGSMLFNQRARVGASAIAHKLPALGVAAEQVPYGLLLSYGQDAPDFFRRAVTYVDKILKGANPADLPVEQPTRFKLVVNAKAAKELGLTIPEAFLLRADEVIE